jgi:CRP/FNR family transcriptional regulator, cyclic AMP receptor protein
LGQVFPELGWTRNQLVKSGHIPEQELTVLGVRNYQPNGAVRLLGGAAAALPIAAEAIPKTERNGSWNARREENRTECSSFGQGVHRREAEALHAAASDLNALLYLFACKVQWENDSDTTAAWEIISATQSRQEGTRAHALSLIEQTEGMGRDASITGPADRERRQFAATEAGMRAPYGLEIIESCMGCKASREGFFCRFSTPVTRSTDLVSHHTVMPAGAVLFVEGQAPRGVFILCSGKVKLSTTSKEGKVLILKQAEAGEVLGLSAAVSNTSYEMTAETGSPCQLNFIGRADLMNLLQKESEVGVHASLWLSREFQSAYRDIHDLVLARSSSGKLARLLLSCAPAEGKHWEEQQLRSTMTHEEMAQRIGSSRETVTRLLSDLKRRKLIRLEGTTLVIRDRNQLEAMVV